jgi:hypothetical protein
MYHSCTAVSHVALKCMQPQHNTGSTLLSRLPTRVLEREQLSTGNTQAMKESSHNPNWYVAFLAQKATQHPVVTTPCQVSLVDSTAAKCNAASFPGEQVQNISCSSPKLHPMCSTLKHPAGCKSQFADCLPHALCCLSVCSRPSGRYGRFG